MEQQELLQKIQNWIALHRPQMEEEIMRLTRIPSIADAKSEIQPYGQACRDVLDEMIQIGKEHGFQTENYEYYCGSMWLDERAAHVEDCIGFWGHLDVVPVGNGWEYSPFEPFLKDGYIVGRGAQDNKGPTIATMYLMLCFQELGIHTKYPLRMFFGCDEERGMGDLQYYRKHYPCPKMSIIADSGFPVCYGEKGIIEANLVADEPFSQQILNFAGGSASNMVPSHAEVKLCGDDTVQQAAEGLSGLWKVEKDDSGVQITTCGIGKHTAFPEGGVNAISKMTRGLLAMGCLTEQDEQKLMFLTEANQGWYGRGLGIGFEDDLSGKLTCVGSMCGMDEQHRPWLHVNIRYSISADAAQLMNQMEKVCQEHGFHFDLLRESAPNYFPREHPAVDCLTNAYNEVTGDHATPFVMGGGTYARKLPRAFAYGMGIPGDRNDHPMFLPGHGGAHEPDEALKVDSLVRAMHIFAAGLLSLNHIEIDVD